MTTLYSNLDHELDESEIKSAMEDGEYRDHTAWNFCGHIRYDNKQNIWIEEVWRYYALVETKKNNDLLELINDVNDKYGHE